MPRARRHFIPGCIWHITHRCHKKEFLLKFAKDRRRWMHWLFEAKKRYGLSVLNYMITSNHVHLIVVDDDSKDVISKSMQLVASRTAQEYNWRKNRKGAYWEDRYHATAIERDEHLIRCIVYLDMNMVRTGAVSHPSDWMYSGYHEIQNPRQRYALINYKRLMQLLNIQTVDDLKKAHCGWIKEALRKQGQVRESKWTQSVAVGGKEFVEQVKRQLGFRVKGRGISRKGENYQLRERQSAYNAHFAHENVPLSENNAYFWSRCRAI